MKKLIVIFVGLVILAGLYIFLNKSKTVETNTASDAPAEDPFDVTLEFYNDWLSASLSTTTDPKAAGLFDSEILSAEVRTYIANTESTPLPNNLNPVLCQSEVPARVGGKSIFTQDTDAQVQILARGLETKSPYQALVDLKAMNGKWQITKITCVQGDTAPEREFGFEKEGYLLKSVPPPLDSNFWHLVYEENGIQGHTVPLFFDETSLCIKADQSETACDPNSFTEPTLVLIQADMLETGAVVKKLHFR